MLNSLFLSKRFENTYNINSLLYLLKKTPLIRNLIDDDIYSYTSDKYIFHIIITIFNIIKDIFIKFLYYALIYFSILLFGLKLKTSFTHVLIIFTLFGIFINNNIFVTSNRNYYSLNLLRMDEKKYTYNSLFLNFFKALIYNFICLFVFKYIIGFNFLYVIIISLFTAFARIISEVWGLLYFQKKEESIIDNNKIYLSLLFIFIIFSYLLSYLKITLTLNLSIIITIISLIISIFSLLYLKRFKDYKIIYKKLNNKVVFTNSSNTNMQKIYDVKKSDIKIDPKKLKGKTGYDYFNTIFFERHKKILLTSAKNYAFIIFLFFSILIGYLIINPEYKTYIGNIIKNNYAWSLFIMYFLNRGSIVTSAMFYNCDRSMLKFNFYREENTILNNFKTRVKTVVKVNLIPAVVLACFLLLTIYITNLKLSLITYISIFTSIILISVLFSIHYLVIYYLLQPYDENMKMKTPLYSIISFLTYYLCYLCTEYTFSIENFTLFIIIYILTSLFLVKSYAPRTFRLK